jgi:hypothetical protein
VFAASASCASDPLLAEIGKTKLVFHDAGGEVALACGLVDARGAPLGRWILFDPSLRAAALWPLSEAAAALATLASAPEPSLHAETPLNAPVLIAPRIFEPGFCDELIAYYQRVDGQPSGVTRCVVALITRRAVSPCSPPTIGRLTDAPAAKAMPIF